MKSLDIMQKWGKFAQVYTHVDTKGRTIHLCIPALIKAIEKAKLKAQLIPIQEAQFRRFLESNAISFERLESLARELNESGTKRTLIPVIYCIDEDGTWMLADGIHRYCISYFMKSKYIASYIVYPALWRQFLVEDLGDMSADELRSSPPAGIVPKSPSPWSR